MRFQSCANTRNCWAGDPKRRIELIAAHGLNTVSHRSGLLRHLRDSRDKGSEKMNTPAYNYDGEDRESVGGEERENDRLFKKLKRPVHAAKRSKTPERLRGMHRRRRKRMGW